MPSRAACLPSASSTTVVVTGWPPSLPPCVSRYSCQPRAKSSPTVLYTPDSGHIAPMWMVALLAAALLLRLEPEQPAVKNMNTAAAADTVRRDSRRYTYSRPSCRERGAQRRGVELG